jgi:Tol biopolymer transport system component
VNGRAKLPAWSADGASIRFTVDAVDSEGQGSGATVGQGAGEFSGPFSAQSIWEMSASGARLHPVVMPNAEPPRQSAGNWTADGKYFLFSGCEEYECNLWGMRDTWNWYRRSQHGPFPLTSGPDSLHVAVPAQTGTRVFAFSFRSQRELQKMDTSTLHGTTVGIGTYAEQAGISPDGDRVVYVNRPDGSLWSSHSDGSSRLRLTSAPLRGADPRWSPKGEQILFTGSRLGQSRQIYLLSSDGGALRPVIPKDWEAASADWLPDGYRIIVSMRNVRTHPEYGLFFLEPTTGVFKELPNAVGFSQPRSSPDGRFIAAIDETGQRMMLYDLQKEKWRVGGSAGLLGTPYWTADSTAVYFQDFLEEEEAVFRRDVASGKMERVAGFGEILRGSASHCIFSGLGKDGTIYVMLERGLTDIYALDLDLP